MDKLQINTVAEAMEVVLSKEEQVACPVQHHFGPGIYIREVLIPAGTFSIGHMQLHEHLNVFLKGRVTMIDENGTTDEIQAPMIFTSPPGRKMGYIHEDMTWLNIYPTEERDIETLESTYLLKSDAWKSVHAGTLKREADRQDFKYFVKEYGLSEATIRKQSENTYDQIPFPHGTYSVGVFDSGIEGRGLFATADFDYGAVIAPARIENMRTPAGRYINHSMDPNAKMERIGNNIYVIALKNIKGYRGGDIGDEITVNYRHVLSLHSEV